MAVRNGGTIAAKQTQRAAASAAPRAPHDIKGWIRTYRGEFAKALPSVLTPERFTRIALSAVGHNPKLEECTTESFIGALMTAAQLGLEPNTPLGQAYLIPYYNHKERRMEVQFQIGYKGMIDLAYRSGEMRSVQAHIVYENDEFEYEYGLNPKLRHIPAATNRGPMIYAYAVFKLANGGEGFEVMSEEDIRAHARKYSKSADNGPWRTDFEGMAKKTVLKQALKLAPLKTEFARGLSADESQQVLLAPTDGEDMVVETRATVEDEHGNVVDAQTGEVLTGAQDEQTQEPVTARKAPARTAARKTTAAPVEPAPEGPPTDDEF